MITDKVFNCSNDFSPSNSSNKIDGWLVDWFKFLVVFNEYFVGNFIYKQHLNICGGYENRLTYLNSVQKYWILGYKIIHVNFIMCK